MNQDLLAGERQSGQDVRTSNGAPSPPPFVPFSTFDHLRSRSGFLGERGAGSRHDDAIVDRGAATRTGRSSRSLLARRVNCYNRILVHPDETLFLQRVAALTRPRRALTTNSSR